MEQEARLEKEREQLRTEFNAEHAARKAKLADDAATNVALAANSRPAKDPSKISGIHIYAPKPRKLTTKPENDSQGSSIHEQRREPSTEAEANGRKKVPQLGGDAQSETLISASPESQKKIASKPSDNPIERSPSSDSHALTKQGSGLESTAGLRGAPQLTAERRPSTSATQGSLADQVAELQRLREALQQDLFLHRSVLELIKDTKLSGGSLNIPIAAPQVGTLGAPPSAAQPAQLGMYPNHNTTSGQLHSMVLTKPTPDPSRNIPILYTNSELSMEDSRPQSRASSAPPQSSYLGKIAKTKLSSRGKLSSGSRLGKPSLSTSTANKGSAGIQHSGGAGHLGASSAAVHANLATASSSSSSSSSSSGLSNRAKSRPDLWPRHPPATKRTPVHLTTSALGSGQAAERLTFWKKATKKLRKLTVSKPAGAKEAAWVVQEESSTQL